MMQNVTMYETLTTMAEIAEEVGNIQKVEKGVQTTFGFERCADRKTSLQTY